MDGPNFKIERFFSSMADQCGPYQGLCLYEKLQPFNQTVSIARRSLERNGFDPGSDQRSKVGKQSSQGVVIPTKDFPRRFEYMVCVWRGKLSPCAVQYKSSM